MIRKSPYQFVAIWKQQSCSAAVVRKVNSYPPPVLLVMSLGINVMFVTAVENNLLGLYQF